MDLKRPNKLRLSGKSGAAEPPQSGGDAGLPAGFPVNEVAELVADLIESTALVSPDRLAAVRGRAQQGGSFAQAIVEAGGGRAAGRPPLAERGGGRPDDGHPRRDPAHRRGRGRRHASARQVEEGADADGAR